MPIKIVPKYKKKDPENERRKMPIDKPISDKNNTFSMPIFRSLIGAKIEQRAKASNGVVEIIPAAAEFRPKSLLIVPINGATDVIGALKIVAMNKIPRPKKKPFRVVVIVFIKCSFLNVGHLNNMTLTRIASLCQG
ncbi:hypothetical protein CDIMF43_90063 [Carnobacterium divergens]|nr:hypothetical protein CDIMF43_90063 [Carnobacterium divergens]